MRGSGLGLGEGGGQLGRVEDREEAMESVSGLVGYGGNINPVSVKDESARSNPFRELGSADNLRDPQRPLTEIWGLGEHNFGTV
uniref:Uncharacterized protein n=1 Tax=Knipowitschia caucasica TaxID=637954 RepID=A0AAV2KUS6_KNICA